MTSNEDDSKLFQKSEGKQVKEVADSVGTWPEGETQDNCSAPLTGYSKYYMRTPCPCVEWSSRYAILAAVPNGGCKSPHLISSGDEPGSLHPLFIPLCVWLIWRHGKAAHSLPFLNLPINYIMELGKWDKEFLKAVFCFFSLTKAAPAEKN